MSEVFQADAFVKFLSKEQKKQLPFAASRAMNGVMFDVMKHMKAQIPKEVKTTNKFLVSSVRVKTSHRSNLRGEVGILERAHFAERLVEGGRRTPFKSKYLAVPVNVKRSSSGKITKANRPSAVLSKPGHFIKEINGNKYICKAMRGKLKVLYVLKKRTDYDDAPYLDWEKLVNNYLKKNGRYTKRLTKELERAMATRK